LDEAITVDLYSPAGDVYSAIFWIDAEADTTTGDYGLSRLHQSSTGEWILTTPVMGHADIADGVINVNTVLWWPVDLPTDGWYAVVESGGVRWEGTFGCGRFTCDYPGVSTMPVDFDINPFNDHLLDSSCNEIHEHCDSYMFNEPVIIRGVNFEPNADLILVIHSAGEGFGCCDIRSVYVQDMTVATDSQGSFQTTIRIERPSPCGAYIVFIWSDSGSQPPPLGSDWFWVSCP
jgi:hypothetical protein